MRAPTIFTALPNTAFGISMGLAGQSILWKLLSSSTFPGTGAPLTDTPCIIFWVCGSAVLLIFLLLYATKLALAPAAVRAEWMHPVRANCTPQPALTSSHHLRPPRASTLRAQSSSARTSPW